MTSYDLQPFEDKFKGVTFGKLLLQIAIYDPETAKQLTPLFDRIFHILDVDQRIDFLTAEIVEKERQNSTYDLLLEGYLNLLRKVSYKTDGVNRIVFLIVLITIDWALCGFISTSNIVIEFNILPPIHCLIFRTLLQYMMLIWHSLFGVRTNAILHVWE